MKINKYIIGILSLAILSSITGCTNSSSRENLVSTKNLTADIKEKYKDQEFFNYTEALNDLKRSHIFQYEISDSVAEYFKTFTNNWNTIFKVYKDSDFSQEVAFSAERKDGVLYIAPARNPEYAIPDEDRGGYLNDIGEYKDWGNASQYYLIQYYDLKSGEELKKPEVTCFTIKTELNTAPKIELTLNDKGVAGLKWNEVEGAEKYIIFEFSESQEGKSVGRNIDIIATTDETSWSDNSEDKSKVNSHFRTASMSRDNLYGDLKGRLKKGEITQEEFDNAEITVEEKVTMKDRNVYLGVIAVDKNGGTSKIGNMIDKRQSASQIPWEVANYMNEGGIKPNGDNSKVRVDREIGLASSHVWITMCDGSMTQMLVNYDINNSKLDRIQFYNGETDENGNLKKDENGNPVNFSVENIDCVNVPYTIEGTPFKGYAQITNYDKNTYEKELVELKERQDALRERTGGVKKDDDLHGKSDNSGEVAEKLSNNYKVNASNALSEYLALQMLNGETVVSLNDFKESQNQDYLIDAWYEAVYQNPLVLGVKGIRLDTKGNNLLISYNQSSKEQYEKQEEINEKVKTVIKEIIKDSMTDYEKEEAINDYLCKNAEYDKAALENAEKNNFEKVDEEFNDSFTAYGILINKKGVCASYSAAFQLLAQEAGVKSIVITGNLNGTMPHAWNRVNIDGEWYTLDVTNNDNEFFSNGLFNLSDRVSRDILVEDDLYIMNSKLSDYRAQGDKNEYYHKNQKYYDIASIADKLVEELNKQETVSLRTEYTLNEEEFYKIAADVMQKTQNKNLKGGYFMGVISLQK